MLLPVDRFFNLIYYFATFNADEQEKQKFDIRLNMPDARARRSAVAASSPWSKENEEAALSDFAFAIGSG